MAQRKHKPTMHASLREEAAWFTAKPMREPIHHSEWSINLGNMPKNARMIEKNPDENVGCTITALEYVGALADRKKNLAAIPPKGKPTNEVDARRVNMGGVDKNDTRHVKLSNW